MFQDPGEIINERLKKYGIWFNPYELNSSDGVLKPMPSPRPENGILRLRNPDEFGRFFDKVSPRIEQSFICYTFKEVPHAIEMINGILNLTALSFLPDKNEYIHLLSETSGNLPINLPNHKDQIYILCFTENWDDKKFWEVYGTNNSTGKEDKVALKCSIEIKEIMQKARHRNLLEMRKVYYDETLTKDLKELNEELMRFYGSYLLIDNRFYFSKFLKKYENFSWEKEIRLCADYNSNNLLENLASRGFLPHLGSYNLNCLSSELENDSRRYVKIPVNNPYLKLSVEAVKVGKNVSNEDFDTFCKLLPGAVEQNDIK